MIISLFVSFFGNNIGMSSTSYYTIYVLHDFEAMSLFSFYPGIAAIIAAFMLTVLRTPAEKSRIFVSSHVFLGAGLLMIFLAGDNRPVLITALILRGLGTGIGSATIMALFAETIEVTARQTGKMIAGMGFAGMNAVQKLSGGLATAVFGAVMARAGFDASLDSRGLMQPDGVIPAIRLAFFGVPVICYLVIIFLILFLFDIRKQLGSVPD